MQNFWEQLEHAAAYTMKQLHWRSRLFYFPKRKWKYFMSLFQQFYRCWKNPHLHEGRDLVLNVRLPYQIQVRYPLWKKGLFGKNSRLWIFTPRMKLNIMTSSIVRDAFISRTKVNMTEFPDQPVWGFFLVSTVVIRKPFYQCLLVLL